MRGGQTKPRTRRRRVARVGVAILAVWGLAAVVPRADDPSGTAARIEKQRGVSWVAAGKVGPKHFDPLVANQVEWIVQTPFGWQKRHDSPDLRLVTGGHVLWGETDEGIEITTRLAHEVGIHTLLKPHIWLTRAPDGKWRSDIHMNSDADWKDWFEDYRTFILHYARLAERTGIEALCVGTELRATVVEREADWRRLIREIRSVYHGELTYAANWWKEFEEVPFWDALDAIGVQAYFPLSDSEFPTVDEINAGWRSHVEALERVHDKFGKPVLFTEIGYKSMPHTAARPWEWPKRIENDASVAALASQAAAYRSFFETVWSRPWFAGAYFWKWYPNEKNLENVTNTGFTPQGKPAQAVIARWYNRREPSAKAPP